MYELKLKYQGDVRSWSGIGAVSDKPLKVHRSDLISVARQLFSVQENLESVRFNQPGNPAGYIYDRSVG